MPAAGLAGEYDVAVGEQRGVAPFLEGAVGGLDRDRIGPDDFAVADEEHRLVGLSVVPFAGVEEGMLRETLAGQHGGRERGGDNRRGRDGGIVFRNGAGSGAEKGEGEVR